MEIFTVWINGENFIAHKRLFFDSMPRVGEIVSVDGYDVIKSLPCKLVVQGIEHCWEKNRVLLFFYRLVPRTHLDLDGSALTVEWSLFGLTQYKSTGRLSRWLEKYGWEISQIYRKTTPQNEVSEKALK